MTEGGDANVNVLLPVMGLLSTFDVAGTVPGAPAISVNNATFMLPAKPV